MLQVICFSRARPLQLHGYLTSLFAQCEGEPVVSVLVKVDEPYRQAYVEVLESFPVVGELEEVDFASDLAELIASPAEFTMFGCDDVVFVAPFSVENVETVFARIPSLLGLSLRLGQNVTRDMFGNPLPQPESTSCWDFRHGIGDWGYPWEVLGTVYRTEFVTSMVAMLAAGSPSQLEERGSRRWGECTDKTHLAAYQTSRLVVPTVNVVQHEFPNGFTSRQELDPPFLLDCWNHGLRLDTERYASMTPESWRVGDFHLRAA